MFLTRRSGIPLYAVLILASLALLWPGVWEATGLSGKDEYFLGLRTPLEMMARQDWLVPFLDGVPRIRKPPLLYWIGAASYETFGVSLTSARSITVCFAALLVIATAGIARRLMPRPELAWLPAAILLACLGLHTEGRRFMLDIPVVALATTAFWVWLIWLDKRQTRWLPLLTLLLAAAFMVKGPVAFLFFLGGVVALLSQQNQPGLQSYRITLSETREHLPALLLHLLGLIALCAPWFWVVRQHYPDAVQAVVADELESRQFLTLTPGIVFGLLNISLPWFFVFWASLWRQRHLTGLPRLLILWFAIVFLPFLFLKSFDRYLLGALVPLALLTAHALETSSKRPVWAFRSGLAVALLIGGGLALFSFWFGLPGSLWLLPTALYLLWAWGFPRRRAVLHLLAAPALYWLSLLWGVFPGLGIGAIPPALVEAAKTQAVAFYDGPQPALLPILSGQVHRHYPRLDDASVEHLAQNHTPVYLEETALPALTRDAQAAGHHLSEAACYQALVTHGSGLRFARPGSQWADWQTAFQTHDLTPLKTTVCAVTLRPGAKP